MRDQSGFCLVVVGCREVLRGNLVEFLLTVISPESLKSTESEAEL